MWWSPLCRKIYSPDCRLVNTARGAICNAEAIKEALASGHIRGYGGGASFYPYCTAHHERPTSCAQMCGTFSLPRRTTRGARCTTRLAVATP